MASGIDPGSDPGSQDPYDRLGITADCGFEAVQQAKAAALAAAGDDPQERAKVEAAYDAVLMARLRERQTGKISMAAANASEREQQVSSASTTASNGPGVLTRLRQLSIPTPSVSSASWVPSLDLVEGQGLLVRAAIGAVAVLLLLASPGAAELVLSLGTIGAFVSQVKRGRRRLGLSDGACCFWPSAWPWVPCCGDFSAPPPEPCSRPISSRRCQPHWFFLPGRCCWPDATSQPAVVDSSIKARRPVASTV